MKVTKEDIGERIGKFRSMRDMTQKQLSEKSGVGESTIKNAESRKQNRSLSKIDDLLRIADALGISPYYLLTNNEEKNHVVCEELGLSNDAINTIKTLNPSHREALEILLRNKELLFYFFHYFKGDFAKVTFNISSLDDEEAAFETFDAQNISPLLSSEMIDRLERLNLMEYIKKARENERGKDE